MIGAAVTGAVHRCGVARQAACIERWRPRFRAADRADAGERSAQVDIPQRQRDPENTERILQVLEGERTSAGPEPTRDPAAT